jgi:hypothetical protein
MKFWNTAKKCTNKQWMFRKQHTRTISDLRKVRPLNCSHKVKCILSFHGHQLCLPHHSDHCCSSQNHFISFLFTCGAGVKPSPLLLWPFIGLLYQPWMIEGDDCGAISGINGWQGKPQYSKEACSNAALSTTDPRTWHGPPWWEASV